MRANAINLIVHTSVVRNLLGDVLHICIVLMQVPHYFSALLFHSYQINSNEK